MTDRGPSIGAVHPRLSVSHQALVISHQSSLYHQRTLAPFSPPQYGVESPWSTPMPHRSSRFACLVLLASVSTAAANAPELTSSQATLRESVTRGLRVVEKAARNYPNHRTCFSCHHQTLPMFAMVKAAEHGI